MVLHLPKNLNLNLNLEPEPPMYWHKTPHIVSRLLDSMTWKVPYADRTLYLTFDDGPTPGVTDVAMDLLDEYNAKATFFLVGKNAEAHPELVHELMRRGHTIGNHTYSHPNALKVTPEKYLSEVQLAQEVFLELFDLNVRNFRPPYGMITPSLKSVLSEHFNIVMWDVLSGDFDPELSKEKCLSSVLEKSKEGSIIVFHDSLKSKEKMLHCLPAVLAHFSQQNYHFAALPY